MELLNKFKNHSAKFKLAAATATVVLLYVGVLFLFIQQTNAKNEIESVLTPREYLRAECQDPDCDFLLLDSIVTCESRWRMVQNSISSAYGYFQILDSTEKTTDPYKKGERKYNPYSNIDMGIYLYETRGGNPWNESKHCWMPRYNRLSQLKKPTSVGELQLVVPDDTGNIAPIIED